MRVTEREESEALEMVHHLAHGRVRLLIAAIACCWCCLLLLLLLLLLLFGEKNGVLPGGDELQEEASGGVDELGMHVTELLEYEGGEADEDGQTPRGIVGHQVAECVRGEQLELVVDVYGEACEDVDELRVAEGRHEARHQRHACAQQAQAGLVVAARVQLLAQLGQHAVHAATARRRDRVRRGHGLVANKLHAGTC